MNRSEVISRLRAVEPKLKPLGVAGLYLFGSYARDEAGPDSDVDVFVDEALDGKFGFNAFMDAHKVLEDAFPGIEVSYTTRNGIVEFYRPYVERDAIRIF
jgi:predicted nucleotidyltransferase